MKKEFFTNKDIDIEGTSFQGEITCSFDILSEIFGEGLPGDGIKTRIEWHGKTSDGTIFTLYDWKKSPTPIDEVLIWNIGGFDRKAVTSIYQIVREYVDNDSELTLSFEERSLKSESKKPFGNMKNFS